MIWSKVEPVLVATYRLLNAEREKVSQEAVCAELGRPPHDETTVRALALLYEDKFIGGFMVDQSPAPILITATPKGLQYTSGWPAEEGGSRQVELLLQLLDDRIKSDEVPEAEKGKLRQIRDGVGSASRDIVVSVLAAYVARMTGGGDGG